QAGRFRVRRHCTPPRSPKLYSGYLLILGCATPLRLREHAQTELTGAEIVEALPALYAAYPPNELRFHEQFPAAPPYRAAYSGSRCCCFCFDFTVRGQLKGRWRWTGHCGGGESSVRARGDCRSIQEVDRAVRQDFIRLLGQLR